MKQRDSLGDRMKGYENNSRFYLTRRVPVIVRLDGRAFHTLTKKAKKPFDSDVMDSMYKSALTVMNDMQGCKACYVQSDEATFLLTDYDTINTEPWFGYNLQKMVSISAATMSESFNNEYPNDIGAVFDSRAFNVPKDDVVNNFLWRAKDWSRNSLQMYCRSVFSHKQLHGKKSNDMHNMLFDKGLNWTTDLSSRERNGRYIITSEKGWVINDDVLPNYEAIDSVLNKFL